MKLFGVVGYPVGHSISPVMMNAAFEQNKDTAVYVPFEVSERQIKQAFDGLQALGAKGVNVTIPHKLSAFNWLKRRTPAAEQVGAVNTIRFDEEGAIGHNTDVSGWWRSVEDHVPTGKPSFAVVGAGGASLAILAAIATERPDANVTVVARRKEAFDALESRFGERLGLSYTPWEKRNHAVSDANVVIQTTPLGMWPKVDDSPVTDAAVFSSGQVVQDIVYRPRMTRFASLAEQAGATVVDGALMLLYQGVDAYEWWLGHAAPVETMRLAVYRQLAEEAQQRPPSR